MKTKIGSLVLCSSGARYPASLLATHEIKEKTLPGAFVPPSWTQVYLLAPVALSCCPFTFDNFVCGSLLGHSILGAVRVTYVAACQNISFLPAWSESFAE